MDARRAEARQFALLTRHFFGRLFRNDMIDFEDQMKERLIVVLTLLAVFFGWASLLLLFKYHFVPDINRSWQEKNYVFTLMMLVFGLATLLEWDVLFPDRRDFLNLAPLPVRLRTVFAAKLASFVLFIGLFSVATMSLSAGLFSMYLTQWRTDTIGQAVRYVGAHLAAGFAAAFVVFFGVVFMQFLLMALLPDALYRRLATALRFVLAVGLVFLLLSFVVAPTILGRTFHDLEGLKETAAPFMFQFPPLWFVGLYEVLLGTRDPVFAAEARTAGLAMLLALAAFAGSAALSYRRHVLKTLETRKARPPFDPVRRAWRTVLGATFLRTPEERAVRDFFVDTLRTSPRHRMSLVYYAAAGAAVILALVAANRSSFRDLTPANGFLLVLPLLLAFTVVAALRVLVDRPASPEANWIFRLTETPRKALYASGLKKAVILDFLAPVFLVVLVASTLIWDFRAALTHAVFGLVVAGLGVEAAFYRYRKVPFACTWVPGKLKLHFTAIPVLVGLLLTMLILAAVEKAVLAGLPGALTFLAACTALAVALRVGNRRFYRAAASLRYEEEPEAALIQLGPGA
jgi:hypothetical protein